MENKISSWMRRNTKETERGWKPHSERSCSTSREFSCRCSSAIWLRLLDKRVYDNLIHRRAMHPSTNYMQSSLLRAHSCHTTHAGIIAQSSLCVLYVLASAHVTESRDAGEENSIVWRYHILSSLSFPLALPLYTNHLLYFSSGPILAIWYFGCHLSLLSDLP